MQEAWGVGKARPEKVESQFPTSEALIGVQLRQVEVDQQDKHTPASIGNNISQIDHSPQQEAY